MKVFLSGSFDPLHSGHVALFEKASEYGDLYVGIGSDMSVTTYKHKVFIPQQERLYMVKAIRHVTDASINPGSGFLDYIHNPMFKEADILIVNKERETQSMREFCRRTKKQYIVFDRIHPEGLPKRSSTEFRNYADNNY